LVASNKSLKPIFKAFHRKLGSAMAIFSLLSEWTKRTFGITKRFATLEERVTALENDLKMQPPEACPFCGERGMRLLQQSPLLGNQGSQWTDEIWNCEKCGKKYHKRQPL
jgi:ribosomal protein L37AE/L43A